MDICPQLAAGRVYPPREPKSCSNRNRVSLADPLAQKLSRNHGGRGDIPSPATKSLQEPPRLGRPFCRQFRKMENTPADMMHELFDARLSSAKKAYLPSCIAPTI